MIKRLHFDEVGSTSYLHIIAVDPLNDSDVVDEFIKWCHVTENVEQIGQMVTFKTDEAWTMFKLAWI